MKLVIDTDPGLDDAVALILALGTPGVDVVGISTVGGNTALHHTTRNTLRLLELVGRSDIPVASGYDEPYGRTKRETGVFVHGRDGFAEIDLPEPTTSVVSTDAPAFLAQTIANSSEPVTLVTLGPLTNIAHMLDRFPDVKPQRMVMMGGAARQGNVTPVAEFNVWHDPEAAQRVFRSHLQPVMVGLDATHSVKTYESEWKWLRGRGRLADVVLHFMAYYTDFYASVHGERMSHQHDAMAVAEAISPGLLASERAYIDVETCGEITTGMTVVDVSGTPNATVCWSAPADTFHGMIRTALERLTDTEHFS